MMSFYRSIWGWMVWVLLLPMIKPALANSPVIYSVKETLAADKKFGSIVLPGGTEVQRSGTFIRAATLRKSLTYCGIKLPSGTRLLFGVIYPEIPVMFSAELSMLHRLRGINLPKGTEIRFVDNSCNIDSFITHNSDIDFGYAKLNGWIYLYPSDQVKRAGTERSINIRGINSIGQLEFWQNGQLQEFYSGESQLIKGIPIQANVCVRLDRQGRPIEFVLDRPYEFANGKFQFNDRVKVDATGNASLIDRSENNRPPMTNCGSSD
jgi:hypothetical protein